MAFVLLPAAACVAPAWCQDFSITNPQKPVDAGRRDLLRQLQAWWDVHAYYPSHASHNNEAGTVGVRLGILPDGRIASVVVADSSESDSLDAAAVKAFTGGFVRPLPEGAPETTLDLSLHYVLAHRHNQPVPAGYKPVPAKGPFTISNDPVTSPVLAKMLQKTCTGVTVVNGLRNHPIRGIFYGSKLVFFVRPDGTPWVQFVQAGRVSMSPVVQVGNLVSWTGPRSGKHAEPISNHYTAWLDGENKLDGCISSDDSWEINPGCDNAPGTLDFTCADEVVPQIQWNAMETIPASQPWDPP